MENQLTITKRLVSCMQAAKDLMPADCKVFLKNKELQIEISKHLLYIGHEGEAALTTNRYLSMTHLLWTLSQFKHIDYLNKSTEELRGIYKIVWHYLPLAISSMGAALLGTHVFIPIDVKGNS